MKLRLKELDAAIRGGKGAEVRAELEKVVVSRIPRADIAMTARLAWRANLPELGLRILNGLVRPLRPSGDATPEECGEYAMCLIKVGAIEDGLELLGSLDDKSPRHLLYRALGHAGSWEYAAMIPLLKAYLASPSITRYDRVVAGVNLASALVYEREHRRARIVLRDLIYDTSLKRQRLALGAALELSAVNFLMQDRFAKAAEFLAKAEEFLRDSGSLDEFFVKKWQAFLAFRKSGEGDLAEIREEARARGHWETVRDCDRTLAVARRDGQLGLHLYAGTPYASFREKLVRDLGKPMGLPSAYEWRLVAGANPARLDLADAPGLKSGQLLHRLLLALSRDFYRPARVATLHFQIFPGEHYNPVTSPRRVHEAVRRLRIWLAESELPLVISDGYALTASAPFVLRVPLQARVDKHSRELRQLQEKFRTQEFSVVEASGFLAAPERTVSRILKDAETSGVVARSGRARATRYRFTG